MRGGLGREELQVDAQRQHPVVAGKPRGGGLGGRRARRGQGVESAEEPLALLLPGRIPEALRRVEGGDGDTARVAEREVGKAGQAGLVSVDDVEAVARERQLEVRAHADGNAEAAPAGNRNGGAERDDALERGSGGAEPLQRAPAGRQLSRPSGRRQDDDLVTSPAKLGGRARDVVVHRMRLRPGERGDHADPKSSWLHTHDSTAPLEGSPGPRYGRSVNPVERSNHVSSGHCGDRSRAGRGGGEAEGRQAHGPPGRGRCRARGELPGQRARERRSPGRPASAT